MSSASSWIECSISGEASCARRGLPLRSQGRLGDVAIGDRRVALLGQLDVELGQLGNLTGGPREALATCSLSSSVTSTLRPLTSIRTAMAPSVGSHQKLLRRRRSGAKGAGEDGPVDLSEAPARRRAVAQARERGARGQHVVDQQDRGRRRAQRLDSRRGGEPVGAPPADLARAVRPAQAPVQGQRQLRPASAAAISSGRVEAAAAPAGGGGGHGDERLRAPAAAGAAAAIRAASGPASRRRPPNLSAATSSRGTPHNAPPSATRSRPGAARARGALARPGPGRSALQIGLGVRTRAPARRAAGAGQ